MSLNLYRYRLFECNPTQPDFINIRGDCFVFLHGSIKSSLSNFQQIRPRIDSRQIPICFPRRRSHNRIDYPAVDRRRLSFGDIQFYHSSGCSWASGDNWSISASILDFKSRNVRSSILIITAWTKRFLTFSSRQIT